MDWTAAIGILGGVLTSVAMLPQVIKAIKTKDTRDISVFMVLLMVAGLAIWVYYGILRNDKPIIYTNAFSFLVNTTLLLLHLKYKGRK